MSDDEGKRRVAASSSICAAPSRRWPDAVRERLDSPAPSTRRRPSPRRKKKDKKKKLAAVAEDADPDALDLSQIDLTAPLRADEVMPQRQHRVVEAAPRSEPDWAAPAKPKKKEKKEKKSKKSKKKKGGFGGRFTRLRHFIAAAASRNRFR